MYSTHSVYKLEYGWSVVWKHKGLGHNLCIVQTRQTCLNTCTNCTVQFTCELLDMKIMQQQRTGYVFHRTLVFILSPTGHAPNIPGRNGRDSSYT